MTFEIPLPQIPMTCRPWPLKGSRDGLETVHEPSEIVYKICMMYICAFFR